jgi:hypothetical protein
MSLETVGNRLTSQNERSMLEGFAIWQLHPRWTNNKLS